ncbi:hypothetical protein AQJ64_15335 [Streptomyces griseoruber]|uniref:Uncharacterized protein n=1 Tax=Streptomyces griseoruber TaxID=1943 RepID=A0A117RD38_9ACTN|nr:hypothetical protein AQJ64_15335 [Streptomyces griseoruber]
MDQPVAQSVKYCDICPDCGAELACRGTQALTGGQLRWDVESSCSGCVFAVAVCGGRIPDERRDQILAEHGPARLRVGCGSVTTIAVLRVARAEFGVDLADAKVVAERVLSGVHAGTLPEVESLARKLRASGVAAAAVRDWERIES